jgi:hypothetical protein
MTGNSYLNRLKEPPRQRFFFVRAHPAASAHPFFLFRLFVSRAALQRTITLSITF